MKIKTYIKSTDNDGNITESEANGMLTETEKGYKIIFFEDLSGEGHMTKTTLYANEECMRLIRSGEINANFMYATNLSHNTVYELPYGKLPVVINTKDYNYSKTISDNLSISMSSEYQLCIEGSEPLNLKIDIKIEQL